MMKFKWTLCCFLLFAQGICHDRKCPEEFEAFCWSKEKSDFAQIGVQIAAPGVIKNHIQVSGKVMSHPDHVAHVIARVHGVVVQINKNLGDPVAKGEVIAIVESKEMADAKSDFLAALKRVEFQEALLKKEEALKGISSGQDLLEAQFAMHEALLQKELALQGLLTLGLQEQEIEELKTGQPTSLRLYEIKSPMVGKILQRNLTLGELIDDEARVFTVGNFDKVWIEMNVPQNDVHYLLEGLPLDMSGINGKKDQLMLSQFNPIINEKTRTATAVAALNNPDLKWSPGEFVTVTMTTDQVNVPLAVPQEALLQIKGEPYIFVQNEEQFIPSLVKLGRRDEINVEIVSGLKVGESYASCNTFCLKAELEKEEGEHHH